MSDEVSRGRGNGKAAFSSQFPALRAEAAFVAPAFPWSLGPWLDHGTILRRKGVIIGKLGRDQRSGVRDQKRKDLRRRGRGCLGGGGLDRRGGSLGVLGQWGTSRLSPGSPALDFPSSTSRVFIRKMGRKVLAAAALKQLGARILGFQNSGSSVAWAHDRSTMQTKPFVPFTAVVKPVLPSTITSASSAIDFGAALRASAISELWSAIKYASSGAMAAYAAFSACAGAWLACALAWLAAPDRQSSTRKTIPIILKSFFSTGTSNNGNIQ